MADASVSKEPTVPATGAEEVLDEDEELEAMKRRVQMLEEEAEKQKNNNDAEAQAAAELAIAHGLADSSGADAGLSEEDKEAVDNRSIYVGNVDYGASPEEIQAHFASCGSINRVTILCDKFTGHPKGYAYVEFSDPSFVANAAVLNESLFRGRLIKVVPKRTNIPGMGIRGRGGRGGRGRGSYRGGYNPGYQGFTPYGRGRGRGRGRGFA
ncbi:cytoplasmic RNA-binding protein [Tulasnella sp. 419]|nr:cytoplasmic RNA-binding protein [Tulasnella sp. 418]KAG8962993.1 cytoplasmic RNA-binding protein [Tulasnella sp. 419]